jgi:hypothetical protein
MVYIHTVAVSTDHELVTLHELSVLSLHVGGVSVKLAPTGRVTPVLEVITGAVLSITNTIVDPEFVFPAQSVILTILFTPSSHPVHTIPIQSTVPLTVAGSGLQVIPGILTLAHGSTDESFVVTLVPSFAGDGEVESTVGLFTILSIVVAHVAVIVGFVPSSIVATRLIVPSSKPLRSKLQVKVPELPQVVAQLAVFVLSVRLNEILSHGAVQLQVTSTALCVSSLIVGIVFSVIVGASTSLSVVSVA